MRYTRLDQSPEYVAAHEELRLAEVDLMRRTESVAAMRRTLPSLRSWPTTCSRKARPTSTPATRQSRRPPERAVHGPGPAAPRLPLHVREGADEPVPDVHDVDRRLQRSGASRRAEHRLHGGRGGRSSDPPRLGGECAVGIGCDS